jgi:hypothetical protein
MKHLAANPAEPRVFLGHEPVLTVADDRVPN